MSRPDALTDAPAQRNFEALDKRLDDLDETLETLPGFTGAPVAVTGSRADPEQALASALTALEALGLIDDQTGP